VNNLLRNRKQNWWWRSWLARWSHSWWCEWSWGGEFEPKGREKMIRGGEWKSIKIYQMNLVYILKLIWRPSLLTRSRSHTYNKAIDLWNRVMDRNRNMKRCWQEYLRDWRQQSNQKIAQVLSHISPNTLRTYSRNNRLKTIKVRKPRAFWSGSSRTTTGRTSITNYTQTRFWLDNKIKSRGRMEPPELTDGGN
jgi:hypothetical protein